MKITKHAQRDAKRLFQACLVDGHADEKRVQAAVDALLEKQPRGYLGILAQLRKLVALDIAGRTARIQSAVALPEEQQKAVSEKLEKLHGPGLRFEFEETPELIGGLRVQVGSDVYDGSIRHRLQDLQKSF